MRISVKYSTMIVNNLEESVSFYRDVLGFSEGYHVSFPIGGITIMNSPEGASVGLIESPQFETGLYSIGTDVDNLDDVLKELKDRGCGVLGEITPTTVGRQIIIKDPNGVRLCLIEHTANYTEKYL